MNKQLLEVISLDIQEERRRRNKQLLQAVNGEIEIYNVEDLMRLVGELEAAYNHCVASIAGDGDIYCLLKHLSYAVILAAEVDGDAKAVYEILAALTNGKIVACQACWQDAGEAAHGTIEPLSNEGADNESIPENQT